MIGGLKFFDKKVLKTKKVGEPTFVLVYSTFGKYSIIPPEPQRTDRCIYILCLDTRSKILLVDTALVYGRNIFFAIAQI